MSRQGPERATRGTAHERGGAFDHRVAADGERRPGTAPGSSPRGRPGDGRSVPGAPIPSGGMPAALRPWALAPGPSGPKSTGIVPSRNLPVPAAAPEPEVTELITAALSAVTHHSVVVLDRDLRYRAVAGQAHARSPYGPEDMHDRLAREVLPPAVWERYGPLMRDALDGHTRTVVLPSDVVDVTVEVTSSPVVADGRILGVVVVSRDVAPEDRGARRSDDDLALAFGLTFDHSPICQALLSPDGRWVRVNRAFCELLGRREADLVGRDFRHVVDPRDHGIELEWLDRLRAGELQHYALPSRLVHEEGDVIRVHIRLAAARDDAGELRGFVAQLIDLHLS